MIRLQIKRHHSNGGSPRRLYRRHQPLDERKVQLNAELFLDLRTSVVGRSTLAGLFCTSCRIRREKRATGTQSSTTKIVGCRMAVLFAVSSDPTIPICSSLTCSPGSGWLQWVNAFPTAVWSSDGVLPDVVDPRKPSLLPTVSLDSSTRQRDASSCSGPCSRVLCKKCKRVPRSWQKFRLHWVPRCLGIRLPAHRHTDPSSISTPQHWLRYDAKRWFRPSTKCVTVDHNFQFCQWACIPVYACYTCESEKPCAKQ